MIIISHRGLWKNKKERNTISAFERSFSLGFGIETDIRDFNGCLVISHDMPDKDSINVESVFEKYKKHNKNLPLALNIKADGLQEPLLQLLIKYEIKNYFVFDMSIPDAFLFLEKGINTFARQSEFENKPSFYDRVSGIWMDSFVKEWIGKKEIILHKENNKKVCLVSPELHGRKHLNQWKLYRKIENELKGYEVMLCTDLPQKARSFFCA
jgi:hypothetical protein